VRNKEEHRVNATHFLKKLEEVSKAIRTALEGDGTVCKQDFETFYTAAGEVTISLVAYIALHAEALHQERDR
jgi:hypothetical protein